MSLYLRSRGSRKKAVLWEHSPPRGFGPSLRNGLRRPASTSQPLCSNIRLACSTEENGMAAAILFILLLVLSFGVLLYFFKPTPTESAVEEHLETIKGSRIATAPDGTTILKQAPLSSNPMLDDLIRRLPGSLGLANLINQSGQTWQVSTV